MLQRIVSGGQSGVDRAALDAALAVGMACGGWCPRGRRAEDGPIPGRYPMTETASRGYAARTRRNVEDSDATLVLAGSPVTGGTRLTVDHAEAAGRPCLVVNLSAPGNLSTAAADVARWLREHGVGILNVAGPRESTSPGVGSAAREFMDALIAAAAAGTGVSR